MASAGQIGCRLSVIVPVLDEEQQLEETLQMARRGEPHELIVVDGGSRDRSRQVAEALADRVFTAPRGRASQLNRGANEASGDTVLFLHADTHLPVGYADAIDRAMSDASVVGGRFDVDIRPATPMLRLVGTLMNLRSRLSRIATGDQAIFVRRSIFEKLEGFAEIPLMEDIEFTRRLKRAGDIACLRQRVSTSSRRWLAEGVGRTILRMWTLRLLYFGGVSPVRLHRYYNDRR